MRNAFDIFRAVDRGVFSVPKFDLHVHGNLCLRLKGGVKFVRQEGCVRIVNHCFQGRLRRLEGVKYPVLEDSEGFIGLVPRLPRVVRIWLDCFY